MPQYLHLSPDEILGDHIEKGQNGLQDVLETGVTVEEAVQGVLDGTLEPSDIPMVEVERHSGQWYCLDNRPLSVFRRLHQVGQCDSIKVKVVCRRGEGHLNDITDDFNDLTITVGEKGKRVVEVQHVNEDHPTTVQNVTKERDKASGMKLQKAQDDISFTKNVSKTERSKSSLNRTAMSKSLPSRRLALSTVSQSTSTKASPVTRRPLHDLQRPTEATLARTVRRTPSTDASQNGRVTPRGSSTENQNGRSGSRTPTTSAKPTKQTETKSSNFARSGSGRGSAVNSNFIRSGSGRGTGIISSFARSGSGRGTGLGTSRNSPSLSIATPSTTTNNINRANKSVASRSNGTSSRLSSSSFTNGERKAPISRTTNPSKTISASHSSTSTSSSNGPDEPRTLSEQEMQGSESDDELLFVFDGHGNSQRLPIDMLAETDHDIKKLNHRCWKCRKYFQSKQELWIHKKQTDH